MSFATLTLWNRGKTMNLGEAPQIYLWLYYILVIAGNFMAFLNFKYWITPLEERDSLWQHIRCMSWASYLAFFFIFENATYRLCKVTGLTLWVLVPMYIILSSIFGHYIWRGYVSRKNNVVRNYATCCPNRNNY